MPSPTVYLLAPTTEASSSTARREALWLLKDQAAGWGMSLAGIEPRGIALGSGGLPANDNVSEAAITGLRKAIDEFVSDSECYVAPIYERIDDKAFVDRLADIETVTAVPDPTDASSLTRIRTAGSLWETPNLPQFFVNNTRGCGAAFNIAHPYRGGPVYDTTTGTCYELTADGFDLYPDEGPLLTITATLTDQTVLDEVLPKQRLNRVPQSTSRLSPSSHADINPKYVTENVVDEFGIITNAISGGSVLVRFPGDTVGSDYVNKTVSYLDNHGFSLAGEYITHGDRLLLFKLHPRAQEIQNIPPEFDAAHERRKLAYTEWAREKLPGYRQTDWGVRRTVIEAFNGWEVIIKKPGRKDAEDFIAIIDGPTDESFKFDIEDDQALFAEIFNEVTRHLDCSQSGAAFAEALTKIYEATISADELSDELAELAANLPPHSDPGTLRYQNRRAFLWLLALVFIVEDTNYRFNFHPIETGGPQYRKQGRDQPMNAILTQIALKDIDAKTVADQSRNGDLPGRPDKFYGPDHLSSWYKGFLKM